MVGRDHLGSPQELELFVKEMSKELKKHKVEKQSMRNWSFEGSMLNNIPEIMDKIELINKLHTEIKNDFMKETTKKNLKEIAKQSIHIANYSMMSYLKAKEELLKK